MSVITSSPTLRRRALALVLGLSAVAPASLVLGGPTAAGAPLGQLPPGAKTNASATLTQCVTAVVQAERSVTFAGEMTSIPGSARMEMRVDVLERMPAEASFRTVSAPGLGVWRASAPGVKVYRYLKQVTNLSAPAFYRGAVRFRWLSARGHLIKAFELRTPRCEQPAAPAPVEGPPGTVSPAPAP